MSIQGLMNRLHDGVLGYLSLSRLQTARIGQDFGVVLSLRNDNVDSGREPGPRGFQTKPEFAEVP